MKPFKRILVVLDLSAMDDTLISYSFWFGGQPEPKKYTSFIVLVS